MSITREQLLALLREMARERRWDEPRRDLEEDHMTADLALLSYIGDEDVVKAFKAVEKWYA